MGNGNTESVGSGEGSEGKVTQDQGAIVDHGQAEVMGKRASGKKRMNLMHREKQRHHTFKTTEPLFHEAGLYLTAYFGFPPKNVLRPYNKSSFPWIKMSLCF